MKREAGADHFTEVKSVDIKHNDNCGVDNAFEIVRAVSETVRYQEQAVEKFDVKENFGRLFKADFSDFLYGLQSQLTRASRAYAGLIHSDYKFINRYLEQIMMITSMFRTILDDLELSSQVDYFEVTAGY